MTFQFYFLTYVDDPFVACICIQRNIAILTFMSKCILKSVAKGEAG